MQITLDKSVTLNGDAPVASLSSVDSQGLVGDILRLKETNPDLLENAVEFVDGVLDTFEHLTDAVKDHSFMSALMGSITAVDMHKDLQLLLGNSPDLYQKLANLAPSDVMHLSQEMGDSFNLSSVLELSQKNAPTSNLAPSPTPH